VAARRLILVMLALLVLSSIAAALIPVERSRVPLLESTTTKPAQAGIPAGTFVHRRISAQASPPAKIALEVGDQLGLTVRTTSPGLVEIPAFGELANVDPAFPARLDVLALERGRFPVRLVGKRTIATIVVSGRAEADQPAGDSSSEAPGSSTRASTSGASSAS
jgi:hypothetical protein